MSELPDFEKRIEQRFANDSHAPHWTSEEAEQFTIEAGVHRQRFEHLASHLLGAVIQPRLELLASYFPIADLVEDKPPRHCTCWIGYTHRVPATTKVVFAVEHDLHQQNFVVCYDAHMTPRLAKFNEHDALTLAFDEADDATIASWVERRLLEFLDAYLRVDSSGETLVDETAIDSALEGESPARTDSPPLVTVGSRSAFAGAPAMSRSQ